MAKTPLLLVILCVVFCGVLGRVVNKRKCPEVRAVPHFDLSQVSDQFFVVIFISVKRNFVFFLEKNKVRLNYSWIL